ncbi:MAG: PmoA family protein [Sedimentisphaerales bacterium]|nr:PmoA family protein [Sedimentisphaerales bacterium]
MAGIKKDFLMVTSMFTVCVLFTGCSEISQSTSAEELNPIKITETDDGFIVTEAKEKVMFYQRRHKSLDGKFVRANYIHPLYNLDGEILTEDFPVDHPHHRGVFWAWHQIWLGDKRPGDSWAATDFFWDVYDAMILDVDSKSRALQVHVLWKSPLCTDSDGNQKAFLKETTTIRVHRVQEDKRKIDFEIKLVALEDGIRLGGSEDAKGYGGFTTRIKLPDGLLFTGTDGPVEPNTLSVEAGPWLDFTGKLGTGDNISGLTILCHNSSPGYPQQWILRRKGSAQNPVYPGRHPVSLARKNPLVLRYRLIIHRGKLSGSELDKLQAGYNSELLPSL